MSLEDVIKGNFRENCDDTLGWNLDTTTGQPLTKEILAAALKESTETHAHVARFREEKRKIHFNPYLKPGTALRIVATDEIYYNLPAMDDK